MNKSLTIKSGLTRALTERDLIKLMYGGITSFGNIIIEFKTEAEGLRLANKYKRLASNPSILMNVTFKKIN